MPQKRAKKSGASPSEPEPREEFSSQQIPQWLSQAGQNRKDWRILVQDVQLFIASLLEEKEQELRVAYFDQAMGCGGTETYTGNLRKNFVWDGQLPALGGACWLWTP